MARLSDEDFDVLVLFGVTVALIGYGILRLGSGTRASLGRTERLPGGKGAGKHPRDFDPIQLRVGTAIEMEHTGDRYIAREIAMDHLTENPRYYTYLCKFEREPACRLLGW